MRVLLIYGTTEGQTRKIAEFTSDHLSKAGHDVDVRDSRRAANTDLSAFDAVILAGSVHEKRHQESLENFVFAHRSQLSTVPTLLISVSLSIAFENGESEARDYVRSFTERTAFEPGAVALVAGALKVDQYDYYMSQIVEFVVMKDQEESLQDREFTDWDGLGGTLNGFIASI